MRSFGRIFCASWLLGWFGMLGHIQVRAEVLSAPLADYGDAPASYPVSQASSGASHTLGGPRLGLLVDEENDAFTSVAADGDDLNNLDDEDGVIFDDLVIGFTGSATVTVTGSGGIVDAWIDWDQGLSWSADERIITSAAFTNGETRSVPFVIPTNAMPGVTFARVRVSTAGSAIPTFSAPDGEVEDCKVTVKVADFGDAPIPYPTRRVDFGAWNNFVPGSGPRLGTSIDDELDGIPSANADGDDLDGVDDENGVAFTRVVRGIEDTISVLVQGGAGYVHAWIDWNQDNVWDSSEKITNSFFTAGETKLINITPGQTVPTGRTFGRFRISTDDTLNATGPAVDGEVEDFAIDVLAADFGDAPTNYPVLRTEGGPYHIIGGPRLGPLVDGEVEGIPSPNAFGDDTDISGDEDGVAITYLPIGSEGHIGIEVTVSNGQVNGWIDWDQSGDWNTSEQIFTDAKLFAGTSNLVVVLVPTNAVAGRSYARFRINTVGGLGVGGSADDGEVEDYPVTIVHAAPTNALRIVDMFDPFGRFVKWDSEPWVVYQLECVTNLMDSPLLWQAVGPLVLGPLENVGVHQITLPHTNAYYRVTAVNKF